MTTGSDIIAIGSDQPVHWNNLNQNGTVATNATVSGVLKSTAGSTLATFSLALSDASTGLYVGTIPDSITSTLTDCETYIIELTATVGQFTEFRKLERLAVYRGEI